MTIGTTAIRRIAALGLAASTVATTFSLGASERSEVTAAPVATSSPSTFEPIEPFRFADTRRSVCGCERVDGATIRVPIGGTETLADQVDGPITAAAVTVTIAAPAGPGFATVYPSRTFRPLASTVNFEVGRPSANSTIAGVGADGAIEVFTSAPAHTIVDVTGVFTAADASTTGRFVPVTPRRVHDGRIAGSEPGWMAPGERGTVPLPAGIPADAIALAVNVTSVGAVRPGFLTGFAAGADEPPTSFLNLDGSGGASAAALILPTSPEGLTISNTAGGHLIVDVAGYFTGPSAAMSGDGLFVATTVTRLLDTRGEQRRLWADGVIEIPAPHAGVAALVTNVTLTRTDGPGFVTAAPAGLPRPVVSAVNATRRDQTVPNAAITPVSDRGTAYFSSDSTDLVVDTNGYFTGRPSIATEPVPANEREPKRVLMVGDSTLAGVRNVTASQQLFVGFDPVLDAQGCRRLVWPSCFSDSDFAVPNTVQEAILGTPGVLDVVVVMSGYNDWHDPFDSFIDTIMDAARSKGARQVVWLTLSVGKRPESSAEAMGAWAENSRYLWAAAPRHPDLVVADWRNYNQRSTGWMTPDGVHLETRGAFGLADYLSRWIAHLDGRACTAPVVPGGPIQDPCPNPNLSWRVPDIRGLYDV